MLLKVSYSVLHIYEACGGICLLTTKYESFNFILLSIIVKQHLNIMNHVIDTSICDLIADVILINNVDMK